MPLKKGYKIIGENLRQKRKDIGKSEKEMIGYDTASYRLSQMANRVSLIANGKLLSANGKSLIEIY